MVCEEADLGDHVSSHSDEGSEVEVVGVVSDEGLEKVFCVEVVVGCAWQDLVREEMFDLEGDGP